MILILDAIILIVIAGFVFYGLFFGLVKTVGSLAGVLVGIWLAVRLYLPAFNWASDLFFGYDLVGKVIVFILIFTLSNRLVSFAFTILDRFLGFFYIIPFLKTINRLGGAVFGFLEGGLVLGLILLALTTYFSPNSWFNTLAAGSKTAPYLLKFMEVIKPILPGALAKLKVLIL